MHDNRRPAVPGPLPFFIGSSCTPQPWPPGWIPTSVRPRMQPGASPDDLTRDAKHDTELPVRIVPQKAASGSARGCVRRSPRRFWQARLAAVCLLIVLGPAFSVLLAPAAEATGVGNSNCPHGGNFGSSACYYGVTQYGTYTQFHNNTMYFVGSYGAYLESIGYHINNSLWAYSGSPCDEWIEVGDVQGLDGTAGYFYYWTYSNANHQPIAISAGSSSNNGTNHPYELLYMGSATYSAWIDYGDGRGLVKVGTASGLGYGTCISQSGLELSGNDSNDQLVYEHSDTFYHDPLQWEGTNGVWHSGWSLSDSWIDHPCGQGYSTPDCLNGSFTPPSNPNDWGDNKP